METSDDIKALKELVKVLVDKLTVLEAENIRLKQEIDELRHRLGLNSRNSSKPPSSDGLKKKPAFPRYPKGKNGGQPGHEGKTLEKVSTPDIVIECKVETCTCGKNLTAVPSELIYTRQTFDLPQPKLEITEYQVMQTICPDCGQIHKGEFPQGITSATQYGRGVKAFVTMLTNDCMLSFERTQRLFSDMYGYPINESTIQNIIETGYQKLEATEKNIQDKLIESQSVNSDETGVRCAGKLHWLHVVCTSVYTYLFIHPQRGKEAIEGEYSLLSRFFGWIVHDCWQSYFNLENAKHALCGAHLVRELQALLEIKCQWACNFKEFLLRIYHTPIEQRQKARSQIETEYDTIIAKGQLQEPQPTRSGKKRGKLKRTKGRNLLERLEKHKDKVLAFAFSPEVPFTNNQAERDLRPVKVKLKISGCFRTFSGAEHYARIAGFISTVRKNQINVFKELCNVFDNNSYILN